MNLPNKISTVRILLIPFVLFFYLATFVPFGKFIAAAVFAIASLTDFIDGKIARSRNMVTNLGKFLDSIADKVLVTAGLILIVCDVNVVMSPYGAIAATLIIGRELIVSAFRQIAAVNNVVMAADMFGKIKATFQFITIIFFMFLAGVFYENLFTGTPYLICQIVCYSMLGITVILTIASAINYVVKNRQVLK